MGNGGVFASFSSASRCTTTSTSPVGSFGFTVSSDRRRTRPHTPITYSDLSRLAFAISLSSSLSKTTCVTPPRSRMSMKSNPPRSRTRCTHPRRTASPPTCSERSSPHVWVRVRSPSCSATMLQSLENRRARRGLVVSGLRLVCQVFDGDGPVADLITAQDRDKWDAACISVLDLLADLVGLGVGDHAQSRASERRGEAQCMRGVLRVEDRSHHVRRRILH